MTSTPQLAVDPRLGPRGKLRTLDAQVGAPLVHGGPHLPARSIQDVPHHVARRIRHTDMDDQAVPEERPGPAVGAIEELIRNQNVQRLDVLLHAAHGRGGEDPFRSEQLEAKDVGAEVELGRHQGMPPAVTRQEGHRTTRQAAQDVPVRRITERRAYPLFAQDLQSVHLVQAAPADDPDQPLCHHSSPGPARYGSPRGARPP